MSANKKPTGPFEFGIMELSRFLDRGPASIRKWEADGLFIFPRNGNGERIWQTKDIRALVMALANINRITAKRQYTVEMLMTVIELIEEMNA